MAVAISSNKFEAMNFDYLKLFIRVASTQNISAAGKDFGLSPAASGAQLNRLEEELGVRLINRTTRKVSLTEDGHLFLPHAEELVANLELAKASVGNGSIKPKGTLRVTAPASFARMHLTQAIEPFLTAYPELSLDLHLSDSIDNVIEGGFDVAIRDAALKDSSLVARKLATDKRIVCASPDYIERFGNPDSPEELINHQCISLKGLETWHFDSPSGKQSVKTKNVLLADNGEFVRDVCCEGLGIAVTSTWCSYKELAEGKLVRILREYPVSSDSAIWAVYPTARLLAPKIRVFIDHLTSFFGDEPYWDN